MDVAIILIVLLAVGFLVAVRIVGINKGRTQKKTKIVKKMIWMMTFFQANKHG
jgi:hypothetical protein